MFSKLISLRDKWIYSWVHGDIYMQHSVVLKWIRRKMFPRKKKVYISYQIMQYELKCLLCFQQFCLWKVFNHEKLYWFSAVYIVYVYNCPIYSRLCRETWSVNGCQSFTRPLYTTVITNFNSYIQLGEIFTYLQLLYLI